MLYENTDVHRRIWEHIADPAGHTLELGPGERVRLPEGINDPYLRPVEVRKPKASAEDSKEV